MIDEKQKLKKAGADFWDRNPCGGEWTSYTKFYTWLQHTEPYIFEIISQYDLSNRRVCDAGCGQGPLSNFMQSMGAQVFSMDMSLESVRISLNGADELGLVLLGLQADAENLPFPPASFDFVVSSGVLHHTPDTQQGIDEIYRILRPQGVAVVMLYRSGNPKWWATRFLRQRREQKLENIISTSQKDDVRGTAMHELYGVPIMKAYSNRQVSDMFNAFSHVKISNHQPGFRRIGDILPFFKHAAPLLSWFDDRVRHTWGFYQVIEAVK